jgi:hypothetical protein
MAQAAHGTRTILIQVRQALMLPFIAGQSSLVEVEICIGVSEPVCRYV